MPWLDLDSWPRRAAYEFYLPFADPWFNLTTELQAGPTREWCRRTGASFSLACWFAVMQAANEVAPMRQRLREGGVWQHPKVRIGATVLKPDDTFTYAYYPHAERFDRFAEGARAEQQRRLESTGLEPSAGDDDLLHCTVIPWVRFTSIKHARSGAGADSIPKVALGRATPTADGVQLPVSVQGHHAVMDGLHAGQFFAQLEQRLGSPEQTLG